MDNIKQLLKNNKFLPSKKMGQNFLSNPIVIDEICEKIPSLNPYDCILEIGPGLGAITEYLVSTNKNLICVELDKRLFHHLKEKFNKHQNLTLVNNDFLEMDVDKTLSDYKNVIVIANIPYSITTPIILKCLSCNKIQTLYIMVQKEVANKWIYSKTGNRNASTNIINFYYNMCKVMDIKNTSFVPAPKVDSSMVLLNRKNNSKYDPNFYKFIKQFFLSRRKKLLNNLPKSINKDDVIKYLVKFGYDQNVRPEILNYNQWLEMYKAFSKHEN